MPRIDSQDTRIAGYIARTDDRPVAAGRSANEARERAGIADVDIDLAAMTELDDLNNARRIVFDTFVGVAPWLDNGTPCRVAVAFEAAACRRRYHAAFTHPNGDERWPRPG